MNFYPSFVDSKIAEMPVKFTYAGWAPWNQKLSSDSLQTDVMQWIEKKYGDRLMQVDHPKRGSAYIKLDGNEAHYNFQGKRNECMGRIQRHVSIKRNKRYIVGFL